VILKLVNKKIFSSPKWSRDTCQVEDKDIGRRIQQKEGEGGELVQDVEGEAFLPHLLKLSKMDVPCAWFC
jgi:hypothetical protein